MDEFIKELTDLISDEDAFDADVEILSYDVDDEGIISGRFRDLNNRVFDFTIDEDGVEYQPSANLDGIPDEDLESRVDSWSEGYLSDIRRDAKGRKKPKCGGTSYSCGRSCIGLKKTCRVTASGKKLYGTNRGSNISKERINKLREYAKNIPDHVAYAQSKESANNFADFYENRRNEITKEKKFEHGVKELEKIQKEGYALPSSAPNKRPRNSKRRK